jgi:hypothetical protein
MKIQKIVLTLCFISLFASESLLADRKNSSEQGSAFTDYYGKVNAIYSEESRMVISDISLLIQQGSRFQHANGSRIANIKHTLKPGTPVKYRYYTKQPNLVLKDLKIISMREFNRALAAPGEEF